METRRQFLAHTGAAVLGLAGSARGLAEDTIRNPLPDGSAAKNMITPAAQQAIDQGLAYLAGTQQRDGSFGSGQYLGNVAVGSLAALAMMAGGHQPGRGLYGEVVTKTLRYILGQEDDAKTGYLHHKRGSTHGPMYGHGFGTLFLAEVYGMVQQRRLQEDLRGTLKRAVELIINSQNHEGGWRYTPRSTDADISVTICQIMALRAARNAGFFVPKKTVDRCIEYVKRCQLRDDGGFKYQANGGGSGSAFARSAAGVVALHCAGVYQGPEVERGLQYLVNARPTVPGLRSNLYFQHYYYGHYYAAQAMWTAGGNYWAEWYPAIRDELVNHPERQRAIGCWTDHRFSHDYATAMACIILQIPNNYLPILQK
jgi:hypothetical protein